MLSPPLDYSSSTLWRKDHDGTEHIIPSFKPPKHGTPDFKILEYSGLRVDKNSRQECCECHHNLTSCWWLLDRSLTSDLPFPLFHPTAPFCIPIVKSAKRDTTVTNLRTPKHLKPSQKQLINVWKKGRTWVLHWLIGTLHDDVYLQQMRSSYSQIARPNNGQVKTEEIEHLIKKKRVERIVFENDQTISNNKLLEEGTRVCQRRRREIQNTRWQNYESRLCRKQVVFWFLGSFWRLKPYHKRRDHVWLERTFPSWMTTFKSQKIA